MLGETSGMFSVVLKGAVVVIVPIFHLGKDKGFHLTITHPKGGADYKEKRHGGGRNRERQTYYLKGWQQCLVMGIVVMGTKTIGGIVKVATFLFVYIFSPSPSNKCRLKCLANRHRLTNICLIGGKGNWALGIMPEASITHKSRVTEPVDWVYPLRRLSECFSTEGPSVSSEDIAGEGNGDTNMIIT